MKEESHTNKKKITTGNMKILRVNAKYITSVLSENATIIIVNPDLVKGFVKSTM